MKKLVFVCLVLLCFSSASFARINHYFDDGMVHTFDNKMDGDIDIAADDYVFIDSAGGNGPKTHVNVKNGLIHKLFVHNNATVNMSGGQVNYLAAHDTAAITLSGGVIGNGILSYDDGIIGLDGSGFVINGTSLVDGDNLRDFVVASGGYFSGFITGTLANGSELDNSYFAIYDSSDIVIGTVPEPATMALIGLGALGLRRRRA